VFFGGVSWQAYAYAAWEPFLCIGMSMKLLVLFRDRLNKTNGIIRSMSSSAYTAYIIHPFFVVGGTFMLLNVPVHVLVKFVALCPLAIASCFFVSNIVRKAPLMNRVL